MRQKFDGGDTRVTVSSGSPMSAASPTATALTRDLQLLASKKPQLLLYIEADSPPARQYISIDGLLGLYLQARYLRAPN